MYRWGLHVLFGTWILSSSYLNFFGGSTTAQDIICLMSYCILIFRMFMWLVYQVFNKVFWSFYRDGPPFYICKQLVQNIRGEGTFCKGYNHFLIFWMFMWLVYQVFTRYFEGSTEMARILLEEYKIFEEKGHFAKCKPQPHVENSNKCWRFIMRSQRGKALEVLKFCLA